MKKKTKSLIEKAKSFKPQQRETWHSKARRENPQMLSQVEELVLAYNKGETNFPSVSHMHNFIDSEFPGLLPRHNQFRIFVKSLNV